MLVVVSVGALGYGNYLAWQTGWVLPIASVLVLIFTLYVVNMAYGYFVESRSKRQFTELFGQYVPPELVDKMAEDPEKYTMEPKAAELSILFSDVRGFTSISEALSPEDLREYINDYLTTMSTIIRSSFRGTLDKYIGDAIMAYWGPPYNDENDQAHLAVRAALDQPFLHEYNDGAGIPAHQRRKIFGRFVRLGSELERKQPGTGLGLYIVRTLVSLFGYSFSKQRKS